MSSAIKDAFFSTPVQPQCHLPLQRNSVARPCSHNVICHYRGILYHARAASMSSAITEEFCSTPVQPQCHLPLQRYSVPRPCSHNVICHYRGIQFHARAAAMSSATIEAFCFTPVQPQCHLPLQSHSVPRPCSHNVICHYRGILFHARAASMSSAINYPMPFMSMLSRYPIYGLVCNMPYLEPSNCNHNQCLVSEQFMPHAHPLQCAMPDGVCSPRVPVHNQDWHGLRHGK